MTVGGSYNSTELYTDAPSTNTDGCRFVLLKFIKKKKVKPMSYLPVITNSFLCTHQKDSLQAWSTQTKTWNDVQGYIAIMHLI